MPSSLVSRKKESDRTSGVGAQLACARTQFRSSFPAQLAPAPELNSDPRSGRSKLRPYTANARPIVSAVFSEPCHF
jgi:hypothetical protein